ncbi:exonuclease SbcC [Pedobacter sp. W3I1]|uniref:AAA family ATPase n=1 Tax=Pedobacter sp. W3I1 TaxID=3042291 RepID=UPI00277ECF52|nr:AAA family ATPase [Pedobacter sp. W3I1]MDQ0640212.1 exonuclease SbcC [Pedobacter sp. W3I1]
MKIKSVEISAFRIYDDPKNANFDFSDNTGDIADFVSLYAPNGFGKTSFYDAVEWAVTKSINRFYIRGEELKKLADFQAVKNKMPLIRNSKSKGPTFVKITSDTGLFAEIFKKNGKQSHDINFKKPVIHDFQQVILSQEWISAFLTESDGELRYKKFMERPDLSEINKYYNNIKLQIGVLENEKNALKKKIEDLRDLIINTGEQDLLSTVNKQIDLLISEHDQKNLSRIDASTTKEQIKKLQDTIVDCRISMNNQQELNLVLKDIIVARTGDENICGATQYFETLNDLENILKEINLLSGRIKGIENLQEHSNKLAELKKNSVKLNELKIVYQNYYPKLEKHGLTATSIKDKRIAIETLDKIVFSLVIRISGNEGSQAELQTQVDSLIEQIDSTNRLIAELPGIITDFNKNSEEIQAARFRLNVIKEDLKKPIEQIKDLESSISATTNILKQLRENIYSKESVANDPDLEARIVILGELEKSLNTERNKLSEQTNLIEQQQILNSNIQEFIQAGLGIVNERKKSDCPLCEHQYNSYNELLSKITGNTALSENLKKMLSDQNDLKVSIENIENQIKTEKAILESFYNLDILEAEEKKKILQNKIDSFKPESERLVNRIEELNSKLTEANIKLSGFSSSEREHTLKVEHDRLTNLKNQIVKSLNDVKTKLFADQAELSSSQSKTELLKNEISELEKMDDYIEIMQLFGMVWPGEEINRTAIDKHSQGLTEELEKNLKLEQETEANLKTQEKKLSQYKLEDLITRLNDMQQKRVDANQKTERYVNFLNKKLSINNTGLDRWQLSTLIDNKEKEINAKVRKNKDLIDSYDKLNGYCDNIEGFLLSEGAKSEIKKFEKELNLLTDKVDPLLQEEKLKTKTFLQTKIQEFFYEKLINDLYKKIDPHPEFKEVQFQADFESDSARLDVFVKSGVGETMLIPNLYFSTAQINILSLSIFLATALNSPKYDCIFIDDPIQSMDSINVLSTIDLFRSIVVNHKKQIILSTHDENFHNLLQKKLPPEKFKSKFLELESFGKLKN